MRRTGASALLADGWTDARGEPLEAGRPWYNPPPYPLMSPNQQRSKSTPPPRPHRTDPPILPIAERLHADGRFAGRGVTIAFLDAGFYAHPDLATPRNRIVAYCDVLENRTERRSMPEPDASSWHGMMTSVVCAGNGALSEGRYRGLAYESDLVLVKVGNMSRVRHDDIREGIQWVIENRQRFSIRVLNISCGGDYEASFLTDPLCRVAEDAVRAGITVVCAAGNSGYDPKHHPVLPPASAPAVISVGGFDDAHGAQPGRKGLYHSSYGPTIDGLQKPEVIAPAIWVAAPILPGTPTAAQAALITALEKARDEELATILDEHAGVDPEFDATRRDAYHIRNLVELKRKDQKVISRHYKHVDGTSFAAPIVSSVVAQMLEANPHLTPTQSKRILIETAGRLPDVNPDRQGWGVINPAAAVARALATRI